MCGYQAQHHYGRRCRLKYDPKLPDPLNWELISKISGWFAVICFCVGVVLVLDAHTKAEVTPHERRVVKIRECIDSGGDPEYSVDKYGDVTAYFGCVRGDA